jgi:hypothetical protein
MSFLDDVTGRFTKRPPETLGETPDLARGRRSSRMIGLCLLASAACAVVAVAGVAAALGGIGAAMATGTGYLVIGTASGSSLGLMGIVGGAIAGIVGCFVFAGTSYAVDNAHMHDGTHIAAYQDSIYPEKAERRRIAFQTLCDRFNNPELAIVTDSGVSVMRPLKFTHKNPAA